MPARTAFRAPPDALSRALQEVLRPEGKGVKHGEDYIRVGLGEEREEMGVGALTRKVTFDEYFNTPTTDAERALRRPWHGRYVEIPFERVDPSKHTAHPEAEIAHFFDEKVKQKVHKFDSVEVCFSKEFPLSVYVGAHHRHIA